MAMNDIPFAETFEEAIKELADGKAQNLAILGRLEDGSMLTSYANAVAEDKAVFAWYILSNALLEVVLNNIGLIKTALDEYEEGEANAEEEN